MVSSKNVANRFLKVNKQRRKTKKWFLNFFKKYVSTQMLDILWNFKLSHLY